VSFPVPALQTAGASPSLSPAVGILVVLSVVLLPGAALAQPEGLRDPTVPPLVYSAKPGTVRNPIDSFRPEHLVAVDGQRYLVWKGRRYGVGDSVQGARIERLDETEVWLRTDGGLRKLPLFAGVEKNPPNSSVPPGAAKGRTQ
jgi:hypothetical protein